jgi:hypothetical protein
VPPSLLTLIYLNLASTVSTKGADAELLNRGILGSSQVNSQNENSECGTEVERRDKQRSLPPREQEIFRPWLQHGNLIPSSRARRSFQLAGSRRVELPSIIPSPMSNTVLTSALHHLYSKVSPWPGVSICVYSLVSSRRYERVLPPTTP